MCSRLLQKRGQRLLVIGASGAVGTSAVQLAAHLGAEVTGVCSGANDIVEAHRYVDAGHKRGNVVVLISNAGRLGLEQEALADDPVEPLLPPASLWNRSFAGDSRST